MPTKSPSKLKLDNSLVALKIVLQLEGIRCQ